VITERELRALPWEVLILLAGGLALGVGVTETGLADWLADRLLPSGLGRVPLLAVLALMGVLLSNLISNTAAATVLMPIALALGAGDASDAALVLVLALSLSAGMCLPVSTPPNALALASGRIEARDLVRIGLLVGVLAPLVVVPWVIAVSPVILR
jgi:sodium-dependent dicarboxylate transporter 2/3/5